MITKNERLFDFVWLTNRDEKRAFYNFLPANQWWMSGEVDSWSTGWRTVAAAQEYRCIYCDGDLAINHISIATITKEHLVPQKLLESVGRKVNHLVNLASCCSSCNSLKNQYIPDFHSLAWHSRHHYVKECRQFIKSRHDELDTKYRVLVLEVLKSRNQKSSAPY